MENIGVVHRDIKPENILVKGISETNEPTKIKIIDFGAAAFTDEAPFKWDFNDSELRVPEWHSLGEYDGIPQTVWTLGLLLHEVVCGDIEFDSSKEASWDGFSLKEEKVTEEYRDLVLLCLRRNPTERPTLDVILKHRWLSDES